MEYPKRKVNKKFQKVEKRCFSLIKKSSHFSRVASFRSKNLVLGLTTPALQDRIGLNEIKNFRLSSLGRGSRAVTPKEICRKRGTRETFVKLDKLNIFAAGTLLLS